VLVLALAAPVLWRQPLLLAMLQGGIAALVAGMTGARAWWIPIHLGFLPLALGAHSLHLPPALWAGGLGVLLLVFWRIDRARVPLYLSSRETAAALAALLPAGPCRVLDLGCGDGGLLRRLARLRPDCRFVGIEHAPLPWAWARIAARGLPNLEIRHGDFWRARLGDFDLVYAFLSPAPMARLWQKACEEMAGTGRLVSNSFPVPGVPEEGRIAVSDRSMTYLYVYRPPRGAN
jgi:SAM-dependent methyltransferase